MGSWETIAFKTWTTISYAPDDNSNEVTNTLFTGLILVSLVSFLFLG